MAWGAHPFVRSVPAPAASGAQHVAAGAYASQVDLLLLVVPDESEDGLTLLESARHAVLNHPVLLAGDGVRGEIVCWWWTFQ